MKRKRIKKPAGKSKIDTLTIEVLECEKIKLLKIAESITKNSVITKNKSN